MNVNTLAALFIFIAIHVYECIQYFCINCCMFIHRNLLNHIWMWFPWKNKKKEFSSFYNFISMYCAWCMPDSHTSVCAESQSLISKRRRRKKCIINMRNKISFIYKQLEEYRKVSRNRNSANSMNVLVYLLPSKRPCCFLLIFWHLSGFCESKPYSNRATSYSTHHIHNLNMNRVRYKFAWSKKKIMKYTQWFYHIS